MPLQQLVEYFNDRYQLEHNADARPFILENDAVIGHYGHALIGSVLTPIHAIANAGQVVGQVAKNSLLSSQGQSVNDEKLKWLLTQLTKQNADGETIVDFDRLSRTLHMLNYLPQAHLNQQLFLDVDPRHILGVKKDHGAYFEEIIIKCGLQTKNVTISFAVNNLYADFYPSLLKGLFNYQQRGYQLALNFDFNGLDKLASQFICRLSPDYVCLSVANQVKENNNSILEKLQRLSRLTSSINTQGIILDINDQHTASLASWMGFDWMHGEFFEQPSADNDVFFLARNSSVSGFN